MIQSRKHRMSLSNKNQKIKENYDQTQRRNITQNTKNKEEQKRRLIDRKRQDEKTRI